MTSRSREVRISATSLAVSFSSGSDPWAFTAAMLVITSARKPVIRFAAFASAAVRSCMRRDAKNTKRMKMTDITNRNSAYGQMTNASTTLATTIPVRIGISAQTIVSQKTSNALSSLFVCDTRAPLKRLEWNATLCSVRWSNTRWKSRAIPLTSIVQVAHSTIRQPITVPRIWLARYPATSGQLFAQLTWSVWI